MAASVNEACRPIARSAVESRRMIPAFRSDGYLPEGLHPADEAEITFRFGSATPRRRRLVLR